MNSKEDDYHDAVIRNFLKQYKQDKIMIVIGVATLALTPLITWLIVK